MTIAGLILMGGRNSRMDGRKKAFLMDGGKPFYQCAAEALPGLEHIYLSVENKENYPPLPYPLIEDRYEGIGPMGGILSGLEQCREDALFVLPCDMPRISRELTASILEAWKREQKPVFAVSGGRVQPLVGIYTKDCIPAMERQVRGENYKMALLISGLPHACIEASGGEGALFNVNTKEEYERMKGQKPSRSPIMIAVSGVKNSGKTTLIEGILPLLTEMGLKTATIKHDGHEFTPDVEGTDSDRHRKAGAAATAVFSGSQFMLVRQAGVTERELAAMMPDMELILLEGMKNSAYPKLEIVRRGNSETSVCDRKTVLAYLTDIDGFKNDEKEIPVLDLNDYPAAARLIFDYCQSHR